MPTNTQIKYKRAIEWCVSNRHMLPRFAKFKLMSSQHLYLMMEAFGAKWLPEHKLWSALDNENGAERVHGVTPQSAVHGPSGRTLVRIIAHRILIGKRVAEFIELCEALNWNVLKTSNPVGDEGDEFIRVYITIMCSENGE